MRYQGYSILVLFLFSFLTLTIKKYIRSLILYISRCLQISIKVRGPGRDHLVEPAADPPAGDDPGGAQHTQVRASWP